MYDPNYGDHFTRKRPLHKEKDNAHKITTRNNVPEKKQCINKQKAKYLPSCNCRSLLLTKQMQQPVCTTDTALNPTMTEHEWTPQMLNRLSNEFPLFLCPKWLIVANVAWQCWLMTATTSLHLTMPHFEEKLISKKHTYTHTYKIWPRHIMCLNII